MLRVTNMTKQFGGLVAVNEVSFSIGENEIVGLIGPNGAGKTTLFNIVSGLLDSDSGSVTFNGTDITDMEPHEIAQLGISRTFQQVRTFNESTVLENVQMGAVFGRGRRVADVDASEHLEFVGLGDDWDTLAKNLTMSDRKRVELARAIAAQPRLLLLDEIASGLTPQEASDLADTIVAASGEFGFSVFWVEHILDIIMEITDQVIVLNNGEKIAEGTPHSIKNDDQVVEAYLGTNYA